MRTPLPVLRPRSPVGTAPPARAWRLALALGITLLTPAAPARALEPDYTGLAALLKQYTRVVSAKLAPLDTRFDYAQLYVDEKIWALQRSDRLATLHGQLLAVSPADLTARERTAWAINTYNLLVIERMTLHLLVPGRKFMRYDSPKQVNTDDGGFFSAPVAKVDGSDYSLTGFERRFVYGDSTADPLAGTGEARTVRGDPRLMFALCKASLCTGPHLPWVYRADSLDHQLARAARIALALPRYLRPDPATGELAATNRFFEERADFGGPDLPELVPFIAKHGPPAARRMIQTRRLTRATMFFEPDWKLDQFELPKPKPPTGGDPDSTSSR